MVKIRQIKPIRWLGAFQVQVANTLLYVSIMNTTMLAVTFWYTAGYEIAQRYAPWVTIWLFFLMALTTILLVMAIDYKFILPSRQNFLSRQSYKHANPVVADIQALRRDMDKVKKALGIEDE